MRNAYDAANIIDAHLVKQALEGVEIPAFIRGEALTGGIGELGVFGLVAVMVPESAWPRARERVLALWPANADGEAPEAGEDDAEQGCPA